MESNIWAEENKKHIRENEEEKLHLLIYKVPSGTQKKTITQTQRQNDDDNVQNQFFKSKPQPDCGIKRQNPSFYYLQETHLSFKDSYCLQTTG